IWASVNGVRGASLPPARKWVQCPDCSHTTALMIACNAVAQVIEWEMAGPWTCRSDAVQAAILPSVVAGEVTGSVKRPWLARNCPWCFSKAVGAPREEPRLIPSSRIPLHPACWTASREAAIAYRTLWSSCRYFRFSSLSLLTSPAAAEERGAIHFCCRPTVEFIKPCAVAWSIAHAASPFTPSGDTLPQPAMAILVKGSIACKDIYILRDAKPN